MGSRWNAVVWAAGFALAGAVQAQADAPEGAASTSHPAPVVTPACRTATSELFDFALRNKEAITLGQVERSATAWRVRRECGDLPGLLSNAVNAARVPRVSEPRTEWNDEWVVPLLFFGLIVHDVTR